MKKEKDIIIVGLGTSAGGLEALSLFLSNIPYNTDNIAYIIAQHLSPSHKSMMTNLLSRETTFRVIDVKSGLIPQANTIYITPPGYDVTIQNGIFKLETPENRIGPKPSIDKFFISLANEYHEKAVGVILSGTGSDGSQGIRAIKAEGGITIAQEPSEAKFDGMPSSAIGTKSIDYILKVADIPKEIIHLIKYPKSLRIKETDEDEFNAIFEILHDTFNIDFSQYKKTTITRRIERRMAAIKATSLGDYIDYLKDNNEEKELLYRDMLIGVTSFFRDKESFETLKNEFERYIKEHTDKNDTIRIWDVACSTGEEAYSIAILMDEILGRYGDRHVKIFATDIDDVAIKKAREGIYTESSIAPLSQEILKRHFIPKGDVFEVKLECPL